MQAGDYMECCLMVVYKFYEMYYSCDVPEDIDRLVTGAMQASSAKPWKEAAPILYGAMSDIMQGGLQQQTGHRETVCDNKLPEIFRQNSSALNDVTSFCKAAIKDMGIDPASVSAGNQAWLLQQGDLEIRLFVFQGSYLFCSAEIGTLPEKNTGPALTYLASAYTVPYRLGVEGDRIYMAYRVHISDIFSDYATDIKKNIEDMASKANEIKDKLHY